MILDGLPILRMVIFQSYICYILNTKRVVSSLQLDEETKPTQNILQAAGRPFENNYLVKTWMLWRLLQPPWGSMSVRWILNC